VKRDWRVSFSQLHIHEGEEGIPYSLWKHGLSDYSSLNLIEICMKHKPKWLKQAEVANETRNVFTLPAVHQVPEHHLDSFTLVFVP